MSSDRLMHCLVLALLSACASTASNPEPVTSIPEGYRQASSPAQASDARATVPADSADLAALSAAGDHGGSAGQWEVTLGASGASDKNFDSGSASGAASLGYYLSDHFELAARQTANFFDSGASGSDTNASTSLAADFVFGAGTFRPLLGASAGYVYGDGVNETWMGGPEAGFKLYVKQDVFLQLLGQYQFFFENSDEIDDQFEDGSFVYSLVFGINF
jgi:hypothetical protein